MPNWSNDCGAPRRAAITQAYWRFMFRVDGTILVADVDADGQRELIVDPQGESLGLVRFNGDDLVAVFVAPDWVNSSGVAAPASEGWNLRSGDQFVVADLDGDGADEILVVSGDGNWVGVLKSLGPNTLNAIWIGQDWVNPPGETGASGWNLRKGDRFFRIRRGPGAGGDRIVVVSANGEWIGLLEWQGADGLRAIWAKNDWVNPPGEEGASGWNLRPGDVFVVGDLDNDGVDDLVVLSKSGQWLGVLAMSGNSLVAIWAAHDWVNPLGETGATGWNLRPGDLLLMVDLDGDGRHEVVVRSADGEWIGVLRWEGGALVPVWIKNDWINPPGQTGATGWNLRSGDAFLAGDLDADLAEELLVASADRKWIGALKWDGNGLVALSAQSEWINEAGGSGPTGWHLRPGDAMTMAAFSPGASARVVIRSPDGTWLGLLRWDGNFIAERVRRQTRIDDFPKVRSLIESRWAGIDLECCSDACCENPRLLGQNTGNSVLICPSAVGAPMGATLLHELVHLVGGTELDSKAVEVHVLTGAGASTPGGVDTDPSSDWFEFRDTTTRLVSTSAIERKGTFVIWNSDTGEIWTNQQGTKGDRLFQSPLWVHTYTPGVPG